MSAQAHRITAKSGEYSAIGKIVVNRPSANLPATASKETPIETLESGELKIRTLERLRALHPESKKVDVKIQITPTTDSSIINVTATGSEPKYTRYYLEAFMDEFIGLRKEMEISEDQEAIMERPDAAVEIIPDLWGPLLMVAFMGGAFGFALMLFTAFIAMRLLGKKSKVLPNPQ